MRGVELQKDGDWAYFCLSFVLALSLSFTNGSGTFLLFSHEFKQRLQKGVMQGLH